MNGSLAGIADIGIVRLRRRDYNSGLYMGAECSRVSARVCAEISITIGGFSHHGSLVFVFPGESLYSQERFDNIKTY